MAYASFRDFCAAAELASADQFDKWRSDWDSARSGNGSAENVDGENVDGENVDEGKSPVGSLPNFICKKSGKSETDFLSRVGEAFDWETIDLSNVKPETEARLKISSKVASQHKVIPVRVEEGVLVVATSNPFSTDLLNAVRFAAQGPVNFVLAPSEDITKAYEKYYGVGAETIDELAQEQEEDGEEDLELMFSDDKEIAEGDHEASIIKFVNQVIFLAQKNRATDIHFEPQEDELQIRHRIDGILHIMPLPPALKKLQAALISRIKVMSGMNIAEKRLPQDGRINVRISGNEIDIRVSTVPTVYGESVSLRLLTRASVLKGMDSLGMTAALEKDIREVITKPHGIMLVTGPTGSGKSTSLYSFLNTINSNDKRIMTVEDPVEYEMKGVNQVHVKNDIGRTFPHVLRHFLRQDPDVIMVGEIRDLETANIAIKAAQTGHLVLSTLHTNSAAETLTRMMNMGVPSFNIATSVSLIIAQRLGRRLCSSCKQPFDVPKDVLLEEGFTQEQIDTGFTLYRPKGCDKCNGGYKGRVGIYEVVKITDELANMIMEEASSIKIAKQAQAEGFRNLRQSALLKVMEGVTSLEEANRVTKD